jgi:hypothetical protein
MKVKKWLNFYKRSSIRQLGKVQMPQEFPVAVIFVIYKKNDKMDCSNFRGILLPVLHTNYKILAKITSRRLKPYIIETVGEYQNRFRGDMNHG